MTTREKEIEKLQDEIKVLEPLGDPETQELVAKKKARLEELLESAPTKAEEKEVSATVADTFDTGLSPDEWDGVDARISRRPAAGEHEAEMGMPEDYTEKAYKFPFTIVEPGPWYGYDGDAFYPLKKPYKNPNTGRVFMPIKNLALACGIEPKVLDGKVTFNLADFAGKRFLAVYRDEPYELETDRGTFSGFSPKIHKAKPLSEKVTEGPI